MEQQREEGTAPGLDEDWRRFLSGEHEMLIRGRDHAIAAARNLLLAVGGGSSKGPYLPVGVGIHTGLAHVGVVGAGGEVHDITALGAP